MAFIPVINHVAPSWHLLHFCVTMSLSLTRLFSESGNHSDFVTTECLVLAMMLGKGHPNVPNEALVQWLNRESPEYKHSKEN